ncbi:Uu.00g096290.m01.CDS01 [Anthostomella pinea]|uniref:Uu.00g096290.m01.CDS01 n=1 Tax=Anthostomella pinea TaxID=933095 RepID=A0AAI8VC59_9PEZI|nr:Uu.00g096290.m01.CDS01 [Anthostomella pinea]
MALTLRRSFGNDNSTTGSEIFGLGKSVTLLVPESRIFGKDIEDLSVHDLSVGFKLEYAKELLFLLSVGFAKLSVCSSLLALSPDRNHRNITHALGLFIGLWIVTSLLTTAFRCETMDPWDGGNPSHAYLKYQCITDIITDAMLIVLPIGIIFPLHMPFKTRATVLTFFSSRLLVIAATVCQLVYLPRLFEENYTLRAFPYYLSTQLVQLFGISTACVIYFWPFLRSLSTGQMWANNTTFPSKYALSKLSVPNRSGQHVSPGSPTAKDRSRRDYMKITAENIVTLTVRAPGPEQDVSEGMHRYKQSWNNVP